MRSYSGEAASVGAAMTWAVSTILYERHGQAVPVVDLNTLRTAVSAAVFFTLMQLGASPWPAPSAALLLALSGLLTFGLSDALFFAALSRIGAPATAVPQCAVPVIVAALSWILWHETLTIQQLVGLLLTLGAVVAVLWPRRPATTSSDPALSVAAAQSDRLVGALCAGLSALLQAVGVLILKRALVGTVLFSAMTVRAGPSALVLLGWRAVRADRQPLPRGGQLGWLVAAILIGTVGGVSLQSYGLQHAPASICTVLNATYPLWLIPLALLCGGRPERSTALPALAALAGVSIVCA